MTLLPSALLAHRDEATEPPSTKPSSRTWRPAPPISSRLWDLLSRRTNLKNRSCSPGGSFLIDEGQTASSNFFEELLHEIGSSPFLGLSKSILRMPASPLRGSPIPWQADVSGFGHLRMDSWLVVFRQRTWVFSRLL